MHEPECGAGGHRQLLSSRVTLPPGAGLVGAFHCSPYHMWALRILLWVLTLVHKRYSTQTLQHPSGLPSPLWSSFHRCWPCWLPVRSPGHMLPCFQQSLKYLLPFYRLFHSKRWMVWCSASWWVWQPLLLAWERREGTRLKFSSLKSVCPAQGDWRKCPHLPHVASPQTVFLNLLEHRGEPVWCLQQESLYKPETTGSVFIWLVDWAQVNLTANIVQKVDLYLNVWTLISL